MGLGLLIFSGSYYTRLFREKPHKISDKNGPKKKIVHIVDMKIHKSDIHIRGPDIHIHGSNIHIRIIIKDMVPWYSMNFEKGSCGSSISYEPYHGLHEL